MVTRYTNLRSPFFVEVTLHVLLLFLLLVFHRYMCDAVRRDFALSASFVLECLDGSEVTTREGNELVVQKENCVVEEIKEVELRSRRGKFIYKGTYNSVGLNKVSHFSRRHRAPSRHDKEIRIFVTENTEGEAFFVWKGIRKNTLLSSEIHCYVKNRKRFTLKQVQK